MRTRVALRFFYEDEETSIAEMETIDWIPPIPKKGDEVDIDDIFRDEMDNGTYDYDYYIVEKVTYSYSEKLILVDVYVSGMYFEDGD